MIALVYVMSISYSAPAKLSTGCEIDHVLCNVQEEANRICWFHPDSLIVLEVLVYIAGTQ